MKKITALKQLGLNSSEISVYLWLLENGQSTPPIVSRETKIARTNCYHILDSLTGKGLIYKTQEKKFFTYTASSPASLIDLMEQKKELAKKILPDLEGLYSFVKNKPKITYFDNFNEIKVVLLSSLSTKTILIFGLLDSLKMADPDFHLMYLTKLQENEINSTIINSNDETAIICWENRTAFINLKGSPFCTLIDNSGITTSLRQLAKQNVSRET
jgi:predicted transcriptional regulator